ncbi:MAG: DUF5926 family protein [Actinomycetota bacterium]|nr:DUF5926 family protein [Actinomycetota bacterium]
MARRQRRPKPTTRTDAEVGPRQPCPCGSGKRYKACHGAPGGSVAFVVRSFEGLPGECDWVALREFVQAGTAPLTLRPDAFDGAGKGASVLMASLLPGIAPALKRADGAVWVGVQVAHQSGDASTDLAQAMGLGLVAEAGEAVTMPQLIVPGTRLQDVVDPAAGFTITVHGGFDFWFAGVDDPEGQVAATLEQLNASIEPTSRLSSVDAGYWVSTGTKEHLRWVMPHDEDTLLTALARLHESGADRLLEGSRLVGSFRAHGLLVPVWDLPLGTGAEVLEEPAAAFAARLGDALADRSPLSAAGRSARSGLANRQLTIR